MDTIDTLFANNKAWAAEMTATDPEYFRKLVSQQQPHYLWIGCSDSRVPANQIVGLAPGEVFVHRNIANVVVHTDLNCLSVIQYAVEVLEVEHIIVCGHDRCGGIHAALEHTDRGLIDTWLRHIRDLYLKHREELERIEDPSARLDRFCRLNVLEQVRNVCHSTAVQRAWKRGQRLFVHGVFYRLADGILQDLACCIESLEQVEHTHRLLDEDH